MPIKYPAGTGRKTPSKPEKPSSPSLKPKANHADKLENPLLDQMRMAGLPEPTREYVFAKPRRWRFDFCWPDKMIAVECEGGIWTGGAHTRGKHYESDCDKYNTANLLGWHVYRFTTGMVKDGRAIEAIMKSHNKEPT